MTRQEQKAVKELSAMISKNTKVIAREHGFKVVSDCAYKVLGDFLYEVFLSAPPVRCGTAIRAVVSVKPCVIDNVFWDVYEMGEVARKKPFSFHITAAHSYGTDELTDFLETISQRCKFAYWFFGHYHDNRIIDEKYILQWEQISQLE